MDKKTIDWLLGGPVWLKYAVETQLLGNQADVQPVLNDPDIKKIVSRLKDKRKGIQGLGSALMNSDVYENPYWDLFFLADLGLKATDLDLDQEIKGFLDTQSHQGTFMTETGMKPGYLCKSAIVISALARLGYRDDPHIKKYIQMFLDSQRLDGGWYCNPDHNIGAPLQHEPSCPQENLNILLILGQFEEYRNNSRFSGAIDLLLRHWELRHTGIQIVYFGVGRRYQSLQYPATRYGILRVLDAISLFPYSLTKMNFHNMLGFVNHKGVEGRYAVEAPTPYTSLEIQEPYNRLLTFIINRVEKRLGEAK